MSTAVVNICKATERHSFIYVGRRCRHWKFGWLPASYFANPVRVGPHASHEERLAFLDEYRRWLIGTLSTDEGMRQLSALALLVRSTNRPLGCWCVPQACHAQVLAEFVDDELRR